MKSRSLYGFQVLFSGGFKMNEKYTAKDILEMAIQAKAKGIDLYLSLAHNCSNYHVGKLFMELAKDEQHDKMELTKWRNNEIFKKQEEAYPGERLMFLKSLADQNTFNCDAVLKKRLENTINEEDALKAGINFEKDFMLFLHDLKRHLASKDSSVIDTLLDGEVNHIRRMFEIKDKIDKGLIN
ncbi:rubrerythrin [Candidatus Omnitrophus magneticus]|uniref:Rubrerythrin n=1 Tax=Candidatus Omnitrophus magneticus TaxID=1609969 RepID=A0A0F0CSI3_9BACT|nr:rubrerythrin [Candidatus Omnitrophus magneticus]